MKSEDEEGKQQPKYSHFENIFDNLTITSGGAEEDHHHKSPHR